MDINEVCQHCGGSGIVEYSYPCYDDGGGLDSIEFDYAPCGCQPVQSGNPDFQAMPSAVSVEIDDLPF